MGDFKRPIRPEDEQDKATINLMLSHILNLMDELAYFESAISEQLIDATALRDIGCDHTVHMAQMVDVSDCGAVVNIAYLQCGCFYYKHLNDYIRLCEYHKQENRMDKVEEKMLDEFSEHYTLDSNVHWKQRERRNDTRFVEELLKDVDI